MRCAWDQLLSILPGEYRREVDRLGRETLQELRLRLGAAPELICGNGVFRLNGKVTVQHLSFVVNTASRYSPWASATVSEGYLTAPGGHRIGLCGEAVVRNGQAGGIREVSSLCIRVARDFPGIGMRAEQLSGNLLVLGPPGWGKTTLLRDVIRRVSDRGPGSVAVVDERGELFPPGAGFSMGSRTDVLTGWPKATGVETVLRTMGPSCIAVDEITSRQDCDALTQAGWCGVRLLATAHASGVEDLRCRPVYRALWESGLFDTALILQRDKSWRTERM